MYDFGQDLTTVVGDTTANTEVGRHPLWSMGTTIASAKVAREVTRPAREITQKNARHEKRKK
jgi:hypothetical protein